MTESFETKVRNVGTSLGVLIPKEVAKDMHIKKGEEIRVTILKQRKSKDLSKLFGIAKGAKPFKREHGRDRF
jgi:hypothetical protein